MEKLALLMIIIIATALAIFGAIWICQRAWRRNRLREDEPIVLVEKHVEEPDVKPDPPPKKDLRPNAKLYLLPVVPRAAPVDDTSEAKEADDEEEEEGEFVDADQFQAHRQLFRNQKLLNGSRK